MRLEQGQIVPGKSLVATDPWYRVLQILATEPRRLLCLEVVRPGHNSNIALSDSAKS